MQSSIQVIFHLNAVDIPPEEAEIVQTAPRSSQGLGILPYPQQIEWGGEALFFASIESAEVINIGSTHEVLGLLQEELREELGVHVEWKEQKIPLVSPSPEPTEKFPLGGAYIDENGVEEGYGLEVLPDRVQITCWSPHGLFNASQSFLQLLTKARMEDSKARGPRFAFSEVFLQDWPVFAMRGVSDDISRGQVPNVESLKHEIKLWSRYKLNTYGMYIEDIVHTPSHPRIGEGRGALMPEEIREIVEFARKRYVSVFPIVETLTHMDNILTMPEYMELGEFPGSHNLSIANGNIYPFLREYLGDILSCFPKTWAHIGGDEPYDLGHGNSKDLLQAVGVEQALYDAISKIYQIAKNAGVRQVVLYHDLVLKYPPLLEALPRDVVILYWNYVPSHKHDKAVRTILESGHSVIVSPSVLCWNRHFPSYRDAFRNISEVIGQAKQVQQALVPQMSGSGPDSSRVLGQLVSTWGDCSNHNLRPNNTYGILFAAIHGWTRDLPADETILADMAQSLFQFPRSESAKQFVELFYRTVDLEKLYRRQGISIVRRFFDNFYRNPFRDLSPAPFNKKFQQMIRESSALLPKYRGLQNQAQANQELLDYCRFAAQIIHILGLKEELRNEVNSLLAKNAIQNPETIGGLGAHEYCTQKIADFISQLSTFFEKYEHLWTRCAKFPNFEYILARYQQLYGQCSNRIEELRTGVRFEPSYLKSSNIWGYRHRTDAPLLFKKIFTVSRPVKSAFLQVIVNNHAEVYCNGGFLGFAQSRFSLSILPIKGRVCVFDIGNELQPGENVLILEARHFLHAKGFLNCVLQIEYEGGETTEIYSDETWSYSRISYDDFLTREKDNEVGEIPWKSAHDLGAAPRWCGEVYHPDLLAGKRSITEDFFRFQDFLYFALIMMKGPLFAKIFKPLLPLLAKR